MQHFSDCDGTAIFGISSNKSQSAPTLIKIGRYLTCFQFKVLTINLITYAFWCVKCRIRVFVGVSNVEFVFFVFAILMYQLSNSCFSHFWCINCRIRDCCCTFGISIVNYCCFRAGQFPACDNSRILLLMEEILHHFTR